MPEKTPPYQASEKTGCGQVKVPLSLQPKPAQQTIKQSLLTGLGIAVKPAGR